MCTSSPCISVIIPSYNYAHFLRETVESVLLQEQDGLALEIIVVDDGSTDDTAAVARSLGGQIRYIHQENSGLSAARNTGIRAARGDFLVFLDADDLLTTGCLASQLRSFEAQPALDAVICLCLLFYKGQREKNFLWPLAAEHLDLHLCQCNISPVHTFMVRKSLVEDIGFFNTDLRACEDQEYWVRCAAAGKRFGSNLNGLVLYRQHDASMSSHNSKQLAFDGALRSVIADALETSPHFPRAGKHLGWLAHAAGNIFSSVGLREPFPALSAKIREQSAQAVLTAAALAKDYKPTSKYLQKAHLYFCASYVLAAHSFIDKPSHDMVRALGYIMRCYPQWEDLSLDQLLSLQTAAFGKLGFPRPELQKAAYVALHRAPVPAL